VKVTTSTGVELDTEGLWAKDATNYAKQLGLTNIIVTVATHKDGSKEYLILEDNQASYDSQKYEDILCHIEMMALAKKGENGK